MNKRPWDWTPLAEYDPIPGEPDEIGQEALRLRSIAVEMRQQIVNLRAIAGDADLVGKAADSLRASAAELAVWMEKAVGRHEKTADILVKWKLELSRLQDATLVPLRIAQEAGLIRARAEGAHAAAIPIGLAEAGPGATFDYLTGLKDAEDLMATARQALDGILEDHRQLDRMFARLIDDATNDEVEDGRWDKIKEWVHRNKGWIEGWTDALGYAATLAGIALIFVPGTQVLAVTILARTALFATAGSGLGHSILVPAGEGSKVDLALDAVGLVTFGLGRAASTGLKSAQVATRAAAADVAGREAMAESLRQTHLVQDLSERVLADPRSSSWARRGARDRLDHARALAERARVQAERDVREAPLAQATRNQQRVGGSTPDAHHMADIRATRAAHPHPEVERAGSGADRTAHAGRAYYLVGTGSDLGDRILDDLGTSDPYRELKRRHTREMGSTW